MLPKATIDINTDATNVNANLNLNLSTTAGSLETASSTVPATLVQQQKTYSQQVATTGQENEGQTASGSINMTAQECAPNLGQRARCACREWCDNEWPYLYYSTTIQLS